MNDDPVDFDFNVEDATPEQLTRMARAVLAVPFTDLTTTPVTQLALGWLRAAHDQILAIAELTLAGHHSATAPNARAVAELAIRIIWLHQLENRDGAFPSLVEQERRLAERHVTHSAEMGLTIDIDPLYANLDLAELGEIDASLNSQARGVVDAAKAAQHAAGIYQLWRNSTQYAHATTRYAGMWAPTRAGRFVDSETPVNWSHALHLLSILTCAMTARVLIEEGEHKDRASEFIAAAVSALREI